MTTTHERDEADVREELRLFGLSDTEIDTYLALLPRGETTTSTVSDDADVTQRAVYNIAERLEDRGLVQVNDHASPTTIRAVPPAEAIGELSDRLESITPTLEERFEETEPQAPEIQMVKTRQTAIKRLREAIAEAEHEAIVSIPEDDYPEIEDELRAAVDRGVLVLLLIGGVDEPEDGGERFAGTADVVRYWGERLPFLYAVDDNAAMIGDAGILAGNHVREQAVAVTQSNLAGAIVGLSLGTYWPAATELYVREPAALPETFGWFRTAVLQAVLHDRAGTDLEAEVETAEDGVVSGRVVEINQTFVTPSTNDFSLETNLVLDTGDDEVSVGGPGTFIEDYEGQRITLRAAD